jgi:hypothetical protein
MQRFTEILIGWAEKKSPRQNWLDADIQREALAVVAFEVQAREGFGTIVKTVLAKEVMPTRVQLDPKWPPVPSPAERQLGSSATATPDQLGGGHHHCGWIKAGKRRPTCSGR